MRLVIGSAFRNCAATLGRYFTQVIALRASGFEVHVIAAEGDSRDDTRGLLSWWASQHSINLRLLDVSHGGPEFGSTEAPERLAALSKIGDAILDAVHPDDEQMLYVESDLIWNAPTIEYLTRRVTRWPAIYAPMVYAGDLFYDVWAFRKDGARFSPFAPYHAKLDANLITEVDSVGSCLVMPGSIAREARMRGGCLVGFCADARRLGHQVFVDPILRVNHPC